MKKLSRILIFAPILLVLAFLLMPEMQRSGTLEASAGKLSLLFLGVGVAALWMKKWAMSGSFLLSFALLLFFSVWRPEPTNFEKVFKMVSYEVSGVDADLREQFCAGMGIEADVLAIYGAGEEWTDTLMRNLGEEMPYMVREEGDLLVVSRFPVETDRDSGRVKLRHPDGDLVLQLVSTSRPESPAVAGPEVVILPPASAERAHLIRGIESAGTHRAPARQKFWDWVNPLDGGLAAFLHSPGIRCLQWHPLDSAGYNASGQSATFQFQAVNS